MLLSRLLINHNHQRNELNISDFCIWVADNQNRSQLRPYKICHKSHHLLLGLTTVLCQLQDPLNEIAFPHLVKNFIIFLNNHMTVRDFLNWSAAPFPSTLIALYKSSCYYYYYYYHYYY